MSLQLEEMSAEHAKQYLISDEFVNPEDNQAILAGLLVYGAMIHGPDKEVVKDWLFSSEESTSEREQLFGKYWNRLEEQQVFQNGKICVTILPGEEGFEVEFALLMGTARGLFERGHT